MKKTIIISSLALAATMTSCSGGYKALVSTNKVGTKVGMGRETIWFGIGGVDISTAKIAKQAGITKIAAVESFMKAGFFHRTYYTKVSGE